MTINSIITGTGSYIPTHIKTNYDFIDSTFLQNDGNTFPYNNEKIIRKFHAITGIEERRYANKEYKASDLGYFAAKEAIKKSSIDPETLDYIIFAHNFGDISYQSNKTDLLPSLAARVKEKLGIKNANCVAYDLIFGCPGWVQGMIQAHLFIKAGVAKKCLVIGGETLSRVIDINDRDSMIYADGAGACIIEKKEGSENVGILGFVSQSHTEKECGYLFNGKSYNTNENSGNKYIKMFGRKIYEYALTNVPLGMKTALENSHTPITDISKILIHQANEKMDQAIVERFYELYNMTPPKGILPMSIHKLGNSSVATVPTLLDLILENKIEDHRIKKGDKVIFASVGAGMNINAFVYQF